MTSSTLICTVTRAFVRYRYLRETFSDVRSMLLRTQLYRARHSARSFESAELASIRLRVCSGTAIQLRWGTTDVCVLDDALLSRYHTPPPTIQGIRRILDLGSNIGITILDLASRFPQAAVLGVELDRQNCDLCRRNIAPFGDRCQVINAAVWYEDGEVAYGGEEDWGLRVGGGATSRGRVEALSIDTILNRAGWETVDFIKMDIEGAEREIFKRPGGWSGRTRALKVELHNGYGPEECMQDLRLFGFSCRKDTKHPACVVAERSLPFASRGE